METLIQTEAIFDVFELEVKARIDDPAKLERRLKSLGAELIAEEAHIDIYYDAPHRDFAGTDEALRVRRKVKPKECILTYKGPRLSRTVKTREEFEVTVDSPDSVQRILKKLGFTPAARVEKERRKYALGNLKVSVDQVKDLGAFIEVEAEADDLTDRERIEQEIFALLNQLNVPPANVVDKTYLEMLLEKRRPG